MSFTFQQFTIHDTHCAMKVGTDGVLLGAWADVANARRILDLGCGSGVIALMAAQRSPQAHVVGVEIDAAAARDAADNAAASPFADRVEIVCADALRFADTAPAFDCIVANPPYHEEDLLPPTADRARARHTSGGGLTFSALLRVAHTLLYKESALDNKEDALSDKEHTLLYKENPTAHFSLILPTPALARFMPLAAVHGFHLVCRTDVVTRQGKPAKRSLLELRLHPAPLRTDELALVGDDGGRSAAYNALCGDFYLKR